MYDRIVVPLDGSLLAEAALDHARNLARQNGTPLFLVRAVDPPLVSQMSAVGMRPSLATASAGFEEEDKVAHEYIERLVDHLRAEGVEANGIVLWGHAASAVASALKDADLLVMSSHGRTGPKRWFMGSVAEDILKRSSIPVFLIRQPGGGN